MDGIIEGQDFRLSCVLAIHVCWRFLDDVHGESLELEISIGSLGVGVGVRVVIRVVIRVVSVHEMEQLGQIVTKKRIKYVYLEISLHEMEHGRIRDVELRGCRVMAL